MKNHVLLLLLLVSISSFGQDFKFKGKTSSIIIQDFMRGNNTPLKEETKEKKEAISFDGTTLLIGKASYKYIWHQNAKENDVTQLNCIERVETSAFPYIDAKFELDFLPEDIVNIIQYRETSPTTFSKITYSVNIIKSSN